MSRSTPPTIADLLPDRDDDILHPGAGVDRLVLDHIRHSREPAYQKILLGVGAALAAFFTGAMIAALMSLIGLTSEFGLVVVGAVLLTLALITDQQVQAIDTAKPGTVHRLLAQVLYLTGAACLATGLAMLADQFWMIPLALVFLYALTLFLFRNQVRAAVCLTLTLVTLPLIYHSLVNGLVPATWAPLINNAYLSLLVATTAFLVHRSRSHAHLTLELRAMVTALSLLIRNPFIRVTDILGPFDQYWIGGAIALGTIALLHLVSREFPSRRYEVLAAGSIGAIALAALGAPGVLLALGILALGYHRADRFITGLGAVQIPVFLFLYYYDLQATLIQKSGLLVLGGLVLLAGYGWISYRMRGQSS